MSKFYSLLAVAVLAAVAANPALAQRKNTTSHDVKAVDMATSSSESSSAMMKCNCGKDAKCMQKCDKMAAGKMKHDKMMREMNKEIDEDYNKALGKIKDSSFTMEQKELLKKQAMQNRDFAMQQLKDRQKLMDKQMQARKAMNMEKMMDSKANRKAVKKVAKIGLED